MKKNINKKPTQKKLSIFYGISQAQLSRLFNGTREISVNHSKRIAKISGRDWTDYLKMTPTQIEADIKKNFNQQI